MLAVNNNDIEKLKVLQQKASASEIEDVDGYKMALLETLPKNTTDDDIAQNIGKWSDKINNIK